MAKYELELQRRYYPIYSNEDTFKTIKTSDNENELIELAKSIKIKSGKTFYEVLNLNTLDQNGDIYNVDRLKRSNE